MKINKSEKLFQQAKKLLPGGVNSPVRAFRSVGLNPPFISKAKGSKIYDVDGNEYIDYVGSWGPMILGHARQEVLEAIIEAAKDGTSFGAPTEKEVILADMICKAVPSIEMVRMVSSGTEAVMSAIRLARGFTGRDRIIKFKGCYHGHSDGLLIKAGSGLLTFSQPDSLGVPDDYARNTLLAEYNHLDQVEALFKSYQNEIATVIVEPVAGNMGVVPPKDGFLKGLRDMTQKYGALLIFDEVITGFRLSYGGAQEYYGVEPDITTLGKIIGGGMPVGAYGGKREIMKMITPDGGVYQAGTLSGNPVAMAAGIKTLEILKQDSEIYNRLEKKAILLEKAYIEKAYSCGIPLTVNRVGGILSVFFTDNVDDFDSAMKSDLKKFSQYFKAMLEYGIYMAPSQFEGIFISDAHTDEDIDITVSAINKSI